MQVFELPLQYAAAGAFETVYAQLPIIPNKYRVISAAMTFDDGSMGALPFYVKFTRAGISTVYQGALVANGAPVPAQVSFAIGVQAEATYTAILGIGVAVGPLPADIVMDEVCTFVIGVAGNIGSFVSYSGAVTIMVEML
jgi:hypothetical protein